MANNLDIFGQLLRNSTEAHGKRMTGSGALASKSKEKIWPCRLQPWARLGLSLSNTPSDMSQIPASVLKDCRLPLVETNTSELKTVQSLMFSIKGENVLLFYLS